MRFLLLTLITLLSTVSSAPIRFNVIGDWGVGRYFIPGDNKDFKNIHKEANITVPEFGHLYYLTELAVTQRFLEVSDTFLPQFVLSTGDQFYDDGLTSRNDTQFKTKFKDVYNRPSVNVTWYPALGNHDYYIDPFAQVNRTDDDWRWYMPDRYYSFTKQLDDGSEALFVVMDVTVGIIKYRLESEMKAGGKYANKNIVQLLQSLKSTWPQQLQWAESLLNSTTAKWKIVMAHMPVFSSNGDNSFVELQQAVQPMLERNNVSAYFSGHFHTLDITENNNVTYIISGAGSQIPYPVGNNTAAGLKDYFAQNPLNMSDYPVLPTPTLLTPPPTAPPAEGTASPTYYPAETAPKNPKKPNITHYIGGYEANLPGFMTCSLDKSKLTIEVHAMSDQYVWSVVKTHIVNLRGYVDPVTTEPPTTNAPTNPTTNAPTDPATNAPTTNAPTTNAPTTNAPTNPTTNAPTNPTTNAPTNSTTNAPTTNAPTTMPPTNGTTSPPTDPPTDDPTDSVPSHAMIVTPTLFIALISLINMF